MLVCLQEHKKSHECFPGAEIEPTTLSNQQSRALTIAPTSLYSALVTYKYRMFNIVNSFFSKYVEKAHAPTSIFWFPKATNITP